MKKCSAVRSGVCVLALIFVVASSSSSFGQTNPFLSSVPDYPNWSAFTGVRWMENRPMVLIDGAWFELVSFHRIRVEEILKECRKNGWPEKRRFKEDLVQIVRLMGHDIGTTTDLLLKDGQGRIVTRKNVTMTVANQVQLLNGPFASNVPGYPKWSAFTGVRWRGDRPSVRVNDAWYELVSFHGIPTAEILKACRENDWRVTTRFNEDLVQIVRLMGHKIERTTDLVLKDASGKTVTMKNVAMTEPNLERVSMARGLSANLSRDDLLADLDAFEQSLEDQFSYLEANAVEYATAIDAVRRNVSDAMEGRQLAAELQKVMALFVDGHAGVNGYTSGFGSGGLSFLIKPTGDRFVAVRFDRTDFIDPDLPYVGAIDGIAIADWLAATREYVARGSPQYVRWKGLRMLARHFEHFQEKLGVAADRPLEVEFVSRDGSTRRTTTIDLPDGLDKYRLWPPTREPEVMEGNIGYMRLPQMNANAVAVLSKWLPRFRETDGLIVDVRGNGGGIRTPILELAGYLLTKDDRPRIGNAAKYRLADQFGSDHLSSARFVYVESSDWFDQRERDAIRRFRANFRPAWEPPAEKFSEWHYLVLSKRADDARFDYRRPVAILMDEGCFSATDIFLGAFKGWPHVTLIGQASSGGSARIAGFTLPNSGIDVRCASMASFQPTGKLYDGNGIEPDVVVERPREYYLIDGPDVILERAVQILKERGGDSE